MSWCVLWSLAKGRVLVSAFMTALACGSSRAAKRSVVLGVCLGQITVRERGSISNGAKK